MADQNSTQAQTPATPAQERMEELRRAMEDLRAFEQTNAGLLEEHEALKRAAWHEKCGAEECENITPPDIPLGWAHGQCGQCGSTVLGMPPYCPEHGHEAGSQLCDHCHATGY